jgi:uncharacterized protein with FMN-binding domain
MRRIVLWAMSTLTVLVLLFGYHTSTSSRPASAADSSAIAPISGGDTTTTGTGAATAPSNGHATGGTGSGGTSASSSSSTTGSASAARTVTGSVAQTRWGPVQVQITVADGRITDVSVVQYPNENGRDQQINARALPVLIDETISAQSASIDMVSGATITSEGYVRSLQSALDQAGL